jgi:hypothetical protein
LRMVKICWSGRCRISCNASAARTCLYLPKKSSQLMMSDSLEVSPASLTMVTLLFLSKDGFSPGRCHIHRACGQRRPPRTRAIEDVSAWRATRRYRSIARSGFKSPLGRSVIYYF